MGVQSKKKLFLLLIVSMVFAVASILVGWMYAEKRDQAIVAGDKTIATTEKKNTNKKANKKTSNNVTLADLFDGDDHIYLNEQLTADMIKTAKKNLPAEEQGLVDQAKAKFNVLHTVNGLFTEAPLKGRVVNEEATMLDDVTDKEKESAMELVNGLPNDAFSATLMAVLQGDESVATEDENVSASWDTTEADVAYADQMLANVVKDGEVITGFTMEAYQNARTAIDALPEGSDKKAMKKELKKVEDAMTSMGIPFE